MAELAQIGAGLGVLLCVEIKKLPEGNFNNTFLLTMNDGNELTVQALKSDAGHPYLTTSSKVATMEFVRKSSLLCSATVANKMLTGKKRSENTGS
jgi:hypothetical protein